MNDEEVEAWWQESNRTLFEDAIALVEDFTRLTYSEQCSIRHILTRICRLMNTYYDREDAMK